MDVKEALESRFSCRAFTAEPVTRAQVEAVVAAASRAPSWANTQPWEVFVAGGETLERIRQGYLRRAEQGAARAPEVPSPASWPAAHQTRMAELRRLRAAIAGADPADEAARLRLARRNFSFFNAPVVVWLCLDRALSPWSLYDLGSFAQSLMLAAAELGLASIPAAMLAAYPDLVRAELGVPEGLAIAIGVALGHPDRDDPQNKVRSPRRPLAEVLAVRGL